MEAVEILVQTLAYSVPAALVVLGSLAVYRNQLKAEYRRQTGELRLHAFSKILPLRLAAYERAILFLERINPANSLQRHNHGGISGRQLFEVLINEMEQEYEHNVVQQLYVSEGGWTLLQRAKLDISTVLKQVYAAMPEGASGLDFAQGVYATMKQLEENNVQHALRVLRNDIANISRQPQ